MQKTTSKGLQAPRDTPLISGTAEESLNSTSLETVSNVNSPNENSKPSIHVGSGCNSRKRARISGKHNVFVLGVGGKPLTPTTNIKARKLMKGRQAKPIWNKFGKFGVQMLVKVGNKKPEAILGIDFGTKFEGYAVRIGKENNLNIMWKLPDKKKLIKKLEERRRLRRAKRFRNCRRRECRFNNKTRKSFIAPSQLQIINSRLKCISELFKCYSLDVVALEDVKFNHRDNRWGKNFSTVEIGKKYLYDWIKENANLILFEGRETQVWREFFGYRKTSQKDVETFNSHCSDALAIAGSIQNTERIPIGSFVCVDDSYRCVRRKLHDTQPSKGGLRDNYSQGNYKQLKKGIMCNFGQICGGIKDNIIRTYDWNNKRLSKAYSQIEWLSHRFKTDMEASLNSPHD